jgi:hypothetical protein
MLIYSCIENWALLFIVEENFWVTYVKCKCFTSWIIESKMKLHNQGYSDKVKEPIKFTGNFYKNDVHSPTSQEGRQIVRCA